MRARTAALAVLTLLGALGACSSGNGSSGPCNVDYDCGAGQTCWSSDGTTWSCMAAGALAWGEACNPSGPVSCGDGLACVTIADPHAGSCVDWCAPNRPCASGTCVTAHNPRGGAFSFCAGGPCADSYDCAAGETCATTDGITYKCVTSGPGKVGDPCSATVNSPVTCGDHLSCLATGDPSAGSCVAWCDSKNPCPGGRTCRTVSTTSGPVDHFCI